MVATNLAQVFPTRVKGIHVTLPQVNTMTDPYNFFSYFISYYLFPSYLLKKEELAENVYQKFSIGSLFKCILKDCGYMHLQATKPDSTKSIILLNFKTYLDKFIFKH